MDRPCRAGLFGMDAGRGALSVAALAVALHALDTEPGTAPEMATADAIATEWKRSFDNLVLPNGRRRPEKSAEWSSLCSNSLCAKVLCAVQPASIRELALVVREKASNFLTMRRSLFCILLE
jgi:hypothetical protein